MLNQQDQETLRKSYSPQLEQLLDTRLQTLLNDLPSTGLDQVQKIQGRALELKDLLRDLRFSAGITANRTAKPQL